MAYSSTDSNFLQEVKELEKQKEEAKDEKHNKDIKGKVSLKSLERDLAYMKSVRELLLKFSIMPTNIHVHVQVLT